MLSRQFREMPRSRIEGLLTSFPKLIPANTQHTSVETADVRYVYQPLEDLYILLITNKASNILLDIDTLHLVSRVVSDLTHTPGEQDILRNSFEIIGAFDEIISLGYREQVNLMQVRNVLEMESHEEKIQEIISRVLLRLYMMRHLGAYSSLNRTRRLKQRRSSSVARNNLNFSAAIKPAVLRRVVQDQDTGTGLVLACPVMPVYHATMPLPALQSHHTRLLLLHRPPTHPKPQRSRGPA